MSRLEIVELKEEIERLEDVENRLRGEVYKLKHKLGFSEEIDTLDAAVFTGYALFNKDNRTLLKEHCERWLRRIKEIEDPPTYCPYCLKHSLHSYYDQSCPGCIERMGK